MQIKYVMKYEMIFTVYWEFNLVAGNEHAVLKKCSNFINH